MILGSLYSMPAKTWNMPYGVTRPGPLEQRHSHPGVGWILLGVVGGVGWYDTHRGKWPGTRGMYLCPQTLAGWPGDTMRWLQVGPHANLVCASLACWDGRNQQPPKGSVGRSNGRAQGYGAPKAKAVYKVRHEAGGMVSLCLILPLGNGSVESK